MVLLNGALLISGPSLRLLRARAASVAPTILFASVFLIFQVSFSLFFPPLRINICSAASFLCGKGQQLTPVVSLSFRFSKKITL